MAKKLSYADVKQFIKDEIKLIRRNFWTDIGLLWLSFLVTMCAAVVNRDGNFSALLELPRLILIFLFSIGAALINFHQKTKEKKKEQKNIESELDIQYDMAFRYSSLSCFNLNDALTNNSNTMAYIEDLLFNITEIVRLILEANQIEGNSITADLMTISSDHPPQRFLEIVAFGPKRPGRTNLKLEVTDKNPLPGAPTAFVNNVLIYVPNTVDKKHEGNFQNREYKSFVSIPISNNEADGDQFAVLNIDSPQENQFQSEDFFASKIYPALKPSIALLKVLHKIGQI